MKAILIRTCTALLACSLVAPLASGCASSGTQETSTAVEESASEQAETTNADEKDSKKKDSADTSTEDTGKAGKEKTDSSKKKAKDKVTYDKKRAHELRDQVQALIDESGIHATVSIIDLTDGMPVRCNGNEQTTSASMIKLAIAHAFLTKVDEGTFALDDSYVLTQNDVVGGSGSLGGRGVGASVTYRELVQHMISESDNTATNALINSMGMDVVNADAKKLGLEQTELKRLMMDQAAIAEGRENHTSANDLATLLRMVYENTFVSKESSELMMDALKNQEDTAGILPGLPAGTTFAHKTGWLDTARHDGGIVLGDHPFVVVVLCSADGGLNSDAAEALMAKIGGFVYNNLAG